MTVLDGARSLLEKDFKEQGKAVVFAEIGQYLTAQPAKGDYTAIAERLRLSEDNVRAMVSRMRKRYKLILRQQILATVSSEDEIDEEIRYLFSAVG